MNFLRSIGHLSCALIIAVVGASCSEQSERLEQEFIPSLAAYCGRSFRGELVSSDPQDKAFGEATIVLTIKECKPDEIRMPLTVGSDASRTWVLSDRGEYLTLQHIHRHEDGSEDKVSRYGGDASTKLKASRQEFPADDYSKNLFLKNDLAPSIKNTWAMEISNEEIFAYELRRPGRYFRLEFDLRQPIAN